MKSYIKKIGFIFLILILTSISKSQEKENIIYGDCNTDSQIEKSDVKKILDYTTSANKSLEILNWTDNQVLAADVDGNGHITSNDASLILQFQNNKIKKFPVEEYPNYQEESSAKIEVEIENGQLVFYPEGEIVAFDLVIEKKADFILRKPNFVDEENNRIKSFKENDKQYLISIASPEEFFAGESFLSIPFQLRKTTTINCYLYINNRSAGITLNILPQGIDEYALKNCKLESYPNPFHYKSNIQFSLNRSTKVDLRVLDNNGNIVKILNSSTLTKGNHFYEWYGENQTGKNVNHGIYYLELTVENKRFSNRLIFN